MRALLQGGYRQFFSMLERGVEKSPGVFTQYRDRGACSHSAACPAAALVPGTSELPPAQHSKKKLSGYFLAERLMTDFLFFALLEASNTTRNFSGPVSTDSLTFCSLRLLEALMQSRCFAVLASATRNRALASFDPYLQAKMMILGKAR